MSFSAIQDQTDKSKVRIYGKGAPDFLLKYCHTELIDQGEKQELDENQKNYILNEVIKNTFAKKCLRTILTAYKDVTLDEFNQMW